MTQEFAPGIPKKGLIHPFPKIEAPKILEFGVHHHLSEGAAKEHYDLRIGDPDTGHAHSWALKYLPKPGEVRLAVQQPTHTVDYMDFKGRIESGYGKGQVNLHQRAKAEIISSSEGHARFNVYDGKNTHEYLLRRTKPDSTQWMIHNVTSSRKTNLPAELPNSKPSYKVVQPEKLDPGKPEEVMQAKIDGAHVLYRFGNTGRQARVYSYRPTERETGVIEHTQRLPDFHTLKVPKELKDTILRGELGAENEKGNALAPARIGGILNASVLKSREKQEQEGKLKPFVFDVVRWKGQNVEHAPYAEKMKMLDEALKHAPWLNLPRTAHTPEQKQQLIQDIKTGKEPSTDEGVVIWHKDKPTPAKSKFLKEKDVYVRKIFAEKGTKRSGTMAGGFHFSYTKDGPIVGKVGTGMSHAMKKDMLERPQLYEGLAARILAQQAPEHYAPRAPKFYGFHPDQELPEGIKTAGQVFEAGGQKYDVEKLWGMAKKLPSERFAIEDAGSYLKSRSWTGGKSPAEILATKDDEHGHLSRIQQSNLRYPILMAPNQGVIDGMHRIAKAHSLGKDTVPIRRFSSWEQMEPARIKTAKVEWLEKKAFKLQGHTEVQGIPVAIENRKGSVRKGVGDDGKEWRTKMLYPYGYIEGTKGKDGEEVDAYVGPEKDAPNAFVVHQHKEDGTGFDEDKVMLGFESKEEAQKAYLKHYDDPKFLGPISKVPVERLREMVESGKKLEKISAAKRAWIEKKAQEMINTLRDAKKTLEPGDILLTRSKGGDLIDKMFGGVLSVAQGTPYYHSAMYVGNNKVVHSRIGEGVTKIPLRRAQRMYDYQVYRVNAPEEVRQEAADFVKGTVGRGYSTTGLLRTFFKSRQVKKDRLKAREDPSYLCSSLIAAAYPTSTFGGRAVQETRPVDFSKSTNTRLVAMTPNQELEKESRVEWLEKAARLRASILRRALREWDESSGNVDLMLDQSHHLEPLRGILEPTKKPEKKEP